MSTGRDQPVDGNQAKPSSRAAGHSNIKRGLVIMFATWRLYGASREPAWSKTLHILCTPFNMILCVGVACWVSELGYIPNRWLPLIVVPAFFLGLASLCVGVLTIRRRLREHCYALCVRCEYPLDRNRARGRCPECGLEYDLDDTRRVWIRRVGTPSELWEMKAEDRRHEKSD
jgi:hypothetical protein